MNINLARKWRSKNFDELVGQPLAVRLIKNSLYRDLLFPVYLFSGTRGTGKTTMARLFAAALNCAQLKEFQKDPQTYTVPCLNCESCLAMQQMQHPDFIEIDAASHTGVDNVRQIIDAASFVPVLGSKKIYLIDEAHMLSKAAFNAFLKILEEPPKTVVFLLATTDPHKIIQTVTSRCFQVFFDPIKPSDVVEHMSFICKEEGLTAEQDALILIAQETEGSMRDALNLLERLRALPELNTSESQSFCITKQMVLNLLGSIDDDRIGELLLRVTQGDVAQALAAWERLEIDRYAPLMVWKKIVAILGRSLWLKQGINHDGSPSSEYVRTLVQGVSYKKLVDMLDLCYSYELTFAKTTVPGTLLQVLLVKLVALNVTIVSREAEKKVAEVKSLTSEEGDKMEKAVPQKQAPTSLATPAQAQEDTNAVQRTALSEKKSDTGPWADYLQYLEKISDPLVLSIFRQSTDQQHNIENALLEVTFAHDLVFFKDWLPNTKKIWQPAIDKFFGMNTQVVPLFTGPSSKVRTFTSGASKVSAELKPVKKEPEQPKRQPTTGIKKVTKEDLASLEKGSLILEAFPGLLLASDSSSMEPS